MRNGIMLLCLLNILFLGSCSKSETTDKFPDVPDSIEIDINEDGNPDFILKYSQVLIESPFTDAGIIGRFAPSSENEILTNQENKSLFLRDLEMIEENVSEPLFWKNKTSGQTIVSISNNAEGEWPIVWDVESNSERDSYFLGLKLKSNNTIQLGWVEIEIDTSNGIVSIVDKGVL